VLPLATRTLRALVAWLGPAFGSTPRVEIDLDRIEALAPEREALWRRIGKAEFLTDEEKREAVGFGRGRGRIV
jgi:phage portal protein BeeE